METPLLLSFEYIPHMEHLPTLLNYINLHPDIPLSIYSQR
jgi:hypothetical protein